MNGLNWYTSYYGNLRNLKGYKISISRFIPFGIGKAVDLQDIRLAPTPKILSSTRDGYIEDFNLLLDKIDILEIIKEYENRALGKGHTNIFLLCYETPEEFCHRHLVAERIKEFRQIEEYRNEAIIDF